MWGPQGEGEHNLVKPSSSTGGGGAQPPQATLNRKDFVTTINLDVRGVRGLDVGLPKAASLQVVCTSNSKQKGLRYDNQLRR